MLKYVCTCISLHMRASCLRTHTSSLRAHTELCVRKHALGTLTQKLKTKNRLEKKNKEANNLSCFKTLKLLNPRLNKHIKI